MGIAKAAKQRQAAPVSVPERGLTHPPRRSTAGSICLVRNAYESFPLIVLLGVLTIIMTAITPAEAVETKSESSKAVTAESWRKTAPALPAPRPFKLPAITTYKLANGLTVQLVEDHRVPFITVNLGIKAGSSRERDDVRGLAAITADMITEGTAKRSSKEIAEEVDFIGGGLKGGADLDFTLIVGSSLSGYADRLLDVVSDVVLNPSFPEDELKLKKTNLIQELVMKRSQPDFLQDERFMNVLFGQHPYGVIAPSPENVEKISRKDLQDFHKTYFVPNESVLIVVGDFQPDKMKALIEKDLGANWKSGQLAQLKFPAVPQYHGRKIYLVDRPGSVQSSIKLGNVAICKSDADYFPLLVGNQVLGGAAHSRLFLNIREQKGYTYGAYSSFAARKEPGPFAAEAEVRTEVTGSSLQEFLYELDRLRNLKVTDKEIQDAKRYLAGSFALGLETQAGLAQRLLEVQLYELPKDYLETYTDKLMAVSLDDVRKAARKDIDLDNMAIVVVGDGKKIKKDLEYFAPVELFDTAGKPVGGSGASAKKSS